MSVQYALATALTTHDELLSLLPPGWVVQATWTPTVIVESLAVPTLLVVPDGFHVEWAARREDRMTCRIAFVAVTPGDTHAAIETTVEAAEVIVAWLKGQASMYGTPPTVVSDGVWRIAEVERMEHDLLTQERPVAITTVPTTWECDHTYYTPG